MILIPHGWPGSVQDILDIETGRSPPDKLTAAAYAERLTDEERASFVLAVEGCERDAIGGYMPFIRDNRSKAFELYAALIATGVTP